MTPPFLANAFKSSSVKLRGLSHTARAHEWLAIIGTLLKRRTSMNDSSEMCETSIIIPVLFISATTSLPNGDKPWCSAPFFLSVEESQISLLDVWHRVIYLTPI